MIGNRKERYKKKVILKKNIILNFLWVFVLFRTLFKGVIFSRFTVTCCRCICVKKEVGKNVCFPRTLVESIVRKCFI